MDTVVQRVLSPGSCILIQSTTPSSSLHLAENYPCLSLQVFWVGPLAGAILASLLYNFVLFHDPKTFAQRLAILKGSYDSKELDKEEGQRIESVSLPSLVHRL